MADDKKAGVGKGCLVVVGLILLLGLVGTLVKDDTPESANTASEQRGTNYPVRGDVVTPNPGYLRACMDSKDGLSELIQWQIAGDTQEMALAMARMGGQVISPNDELKVLDPHAGWGVSKIRVGSTGRECYCTLELVKH